MRASLPRMFSPYTAPVRLALAAALMIATVCAVFFAHASGEDLEEPADGMTVSRYMAYIDAFNRHDLSFVNYYASDIVFDKEQDGLLRGREDVAKWYSDYWKDNNETVIVNAITIDNSKEIVIADITIRLSPKSAPDKERILDEIIFYELSGGLIRSVKGVYHREQAP